MDAQNSHPNGPIFMPQGSLQFTYVLVLDNGSEKDISFFMGIERHILGQAQVICHIARHFPCHIADLWIAPLDQAIERLLGQTGIRIIPLEVQHLKSLQVPLFHPFWVLIGSRTVDNAIGDWCRSQAMPILHTTLDPENPGVPHVANISNVQISKHVANVQAYINRVRPEVGHTISTLIRPLNREQFKSKAATHTRRNHNCTRANEMLCDWLRLELQPVVPIDTKGEEPYIEAIVSSIEPIRERRAEIMADERWKQRSRYYPQPISIDLVVAVPSMYQFHSVEKSIYNSFATKKESREAARIYNYLVKAKSYSLAIPIDQSDQFERTLRTDHLSRGLMNERDCELQFFTALTAFVGANSLAPVVRLPARANHLGESLRKLGDCFRRSNRSGDKGILRNYQELVEGLQSCVPDEFARIIGESKAIKIIADCPLELFPINGFPLFLQSVVSRIPAMPANLMAKHILASASVELSPDALNDILVVRTLAPDDPIYGCLEKALEFWSSQSPTFPRYRIMDVTDAESLVSALNECQTSIIIIDGHSHHEIGGFEIGSLRVHDSDVDVWSLAGRARVPPIVILSSCYTHPLDSTHASVANGFLHLGAISVLGTMLRVDAWDSAIFTARFLLRSSEFVQATLKNHMAIRWSEVVNGMLRLSWVTEVLMRMEKVKSDLNLTKGQWSQIVPETFDDINTFDPNWLNRFIELLSKKLNRDITQTRTILSTHTPFIDTIRYVQLGSPERIWIRRPDLPHAK